MFLPVFNLGFMNQITIFIVVGIKSFTNFIFHKIFGPILARQASKPYFTCLWSLDSWGFKYPEIIHDLHPKHQAFCSFLFLNSTLLNWRYLVSFEILLKVVNFEMSFWCLQFLPKNKQKKVDLSRAIYPRLWTWGFTSSILKSNSLVLFFGRNISLMYCTANMCSKITVKVQLKNCTFEKLQFFYCWPLFTVLFTS